MELPCKIIIFFISNKVVYKCMMMGVFPPHFFLGLTLTCLILCFIMCCI